LADLPTTFYVRDQNGANIPYAPVNYNRLFHGPVSVRAALANSYNIPAVKVLDHIGVQTLKDIAAQAGITSFGGDFGLALTLGGGEVKLLELATAFGIFQAGQRLEHRALLDIQRHDPTNGWQTIPEFRSLAGANAAGGTFSQTGRAVISPETAYLVTHILSDSLARAAAFGESSVLDLPFPAAVKTGTTTDWRDNWTVGYSSERIVGVWTGNADNAPMLDVSGIDGAGPIWRDIMLAAHPTPPAAFPRPTGIIAHEVCSPSGLLPSAYCPRSFAELFISGTEPQLVDDQFRPVTIDQATNLPADDSTPQERSAQRVFWYLPPEYHGWMIQHNIPLPPTHRTDHQSALGASKSDPVATEPLRLTSPASNIAYQIHPSAPRERQRILVEGYTASGEAWHELRLASRLMEPGTHDGPDSYPTDGQTHTLHYESAVNRSNIWWQLETGIYTFWLEGEQVAGGPTLRSTPALVVVEAYTAEWQSAHEPKAEVAQSLVSAD
jgi:membrane carboxypeptidase/penicillin-binding protein PbpC